MAIKHELGLSEDEIFVMQMATQAYCKDGGGCTPQRAKYQRAADHLVDRGFLEIIDSHPTTGVITVSVTEETAAEYSRQKALVS